jgi:hypothetical protein
LLARPLHLEHEFEDGLVLEGPLVVGAPEAHLDEAHVNAGARGDFDSERRPGHGNTRNLAESEGFEPSRNFWSLHP